MELIMARHLAEQTAAILDQIMPDWTSRIDSDRLDVSSENECIIGQLFPGVSFSAGMQLLRDLTSEVGIAGESPSRMGLIYGWHSGDEFKGVPQTASHDYWVGYYTLTQAWRQLLNDRAAVPA